MNRILLLGAGASIPFYINPITTAELTNAIKDYNRWNDLLNRYNTIIAPNVGLSINTVRDVITKIISLNPHLNFEEIIEIIDKFSGFNFDYLNDRKSTNTLLKYFNVKSHTTNDDVVDFPFLSRQLISERVEELQNKKKTNYKDLIDKQNELFNFFITEGSLIITSLNYDEIALESINGLNIGTGFVGDKFELSQFNNLINKITFPHGHSRFILDSEGLKLKPNIGLANKTRIDDLANISLKETRTIIDTLNDYTFNTFLVTGRSKEATFDINPYAAYYQEFASQIATADEIICAGYSLGDAHFNRLILNFLETSNKNSLIIVDRTNHIDPIADFMDSSSKFHRLMKTIGIRNLPLASSYTYKYQSGVDEINSRGYGQIYDRVIYCKEGYELFLNNYKDILN